MRRIEFPALDCVLIELAPDEVAFVATDRYRLAVRTVRPVEFGGAVGRALVRAEELAALSRWAAAGDVVRLEVGASEVMIARDGETREIPVVDADYPAYQGSSTGWRRRSVGSWWIGRAWGGAGRAGGGCL